MDSRTRKKGRKEERKKGRKEERTYWNSRMSAQPACRAEEKNESRKNLIPT
jgi:hypothetical protein